MLPHRLNINYQMLFWFLRCINKFYVYTILHCVYMGFIGIDSMKRLNRKIIFFVDQKNLYTCVCVCVCI